MKLLKKLVQDNKDSADCNVKLELTLVNECESAYYSGMLPGSVSNLYTEEDIQIHLKPLSAWCGMTYIEHRVKRIEANKNTIHLENGETIEYDILALNVGSKTYEGGVKGIWEHALTTRPINDLLPKIKSRENELKAAGIVPKVVVCGDGAAGTELAFGFKARWEELFGQEIDVTLVGSSERPVPEQHASVRNQIIRKLKEKNIKHIGNVHITEVMGDGVILDDGTKIMCDVPIWATGAQP